MTPSSASLASTTICSSRRCAWLTCLSIANQRGSDLATKLEPLLFNLPHAITFPAYPQAPTVSTIASQIQDHVAVIVNRVTEVCWALNVQTGQVLPVADAPQWVGPIQAMPAGDGPAHGFRLDNTERAAVKLRWRCVGRSSSPNRPATTDRAGEFCAYVHPIPAVILLMLRMYPTQHFT